jgi:hypothetical protein
MFSSLILNQIAIADSDLPKFHRSTVNPTSSLHDLQGSQARPNLQELLLLPCSTTTDNADEPLS